MMFPNLFPTLLELPPVSVKASGRNVHLTFEVNPAEAGAFAALNLSGDITALDVDGEELPIVSTSTNRRGRLRIILRTPGVAEALALVKRFVGRLIRKLKPSRVQKKKR